MWYNPLIKLILRSPLHGLISRGILLVTYTGRKTGKQISVPVSFIEDETSDDLLIITFRKRQWWRSMQGKAEVSVRLYGKNCLVIGEAITDPAGVARDLAIYLKGARNVARYLNVEFDEQGEPDPEALARAAENRVMVRIHR